MSGRFQPENGADSAQGLADAIAIADELSLSGRVGSEPEPCIECGRSIEVHCQRCGECHPIPGAIVPRCIACSEPALRDSPYCKGHDRLATYTAHESAGGIAANE